LEGIQRIGSVRIRLDVNGKKNVGGENEETRRVLYRLGLSEGGSIPGEGIPLKTVGVSFIFFMKGGEAGRRGGEIREVFRERAN